MDRNDTSVERIKNLVGKTRRPGVVGGIGGFSAVFDLKLRPGELVLSTTDGVGTKLLIAQALDIHDTVGIDLVAMCANDLTAQNARPRYFLDYVAGAHLPSDLVEKLISGMVAGCVDAKMALIGGELAEMPGMYAPKHYDLAGFAVGSALKTEIITGSGIKPGMAVVGLLSPTHHSNGFSLTRAVLKQKRITLQKHSQALGESWGEFLLRPTPIYHPARQAWQGLGVAGLANITGGGLPGNLARLLPKGVGLEINLGSWEVPALFQELKALGKLEEAECHKTWHMGVGFCVVLPQAQASKLMANLKKRGFASALIGRAVKGQGVRLVQASHV